MSMVSQIMTAVELVSQLLPCFHSFTQKTLFMLLLFIAFMM